MKINIYTYFIAHGLSGVDNMPNNCPHDPKETIGPIGMYHCPKCGEMVLAGMDHPDWSLLDEDEKEKR